MKSIKLNEKDLSILIKKVLKEQKQETSNYMFFSNLEQIKRQAEKLLELDPLMVDDILNNGHDWADDHITEAKSLFDQVFDFLMNESQKHKEYVDYEDLTESQKRRRKLSQSKR
jgi:hypothetical protein